MNNRATTRILCIDDEPNILSALARELRADFDVLTAGSGAEGLRIFTGQGPFPIVVSDLQMPGMDGVTLLGNIRQRHPDTVRILLTGQADLNSAIAAVNEGYIFRFLTKPCPANTLRTALQAAVAQYQLITAEKVLLEQTLQGSVNTLVDILSLASPDLLSLVNRMQPSLSALLDHLQIAEQWPIQVAALLSQIGAITLPDETLQKIKAGEPLKPQEDAMLAQIPSIGEKLLSHIPRLEPVREILLHQDAHYDGSGSPKNSRTADQIPMGARILKILLDYHRLAAKNYEAAYIFDTMFGRTGWYDETILHAFATLQGRTERTSLIREITAAALEPGMLLAEDLSTVKGMLLVRGGVIITPVLLARIQNVADHIGIKEPVRIAKSSDRPA